MKFRFLLPVVALLASGLSLPAQTTSEAVIAQLETITAEQAQLTTNIKALQGSTTTLVAQNTTLSSQNAALSSQNASLTAQVASLQAQLASSGQITAELQKALDDLKAASKANADLLGGVTTPPPTGDDAAIEAELTNSTVAGMDVRLGPKGNATASLPDVWTRPQTATTDLGFAGGKPPMVNYSQGLSITAPATSGAKPNFDFGSTEIEVGAVDDQDLQVNPSNPAAVNSDGGPGPAGVGVYRLRVEEHANGAVQLAPVIPWNDPKVIPDLQAVVGHTASYGMGNKLGRCIQMVRARINRYDGGFGLYDLTRGGPAYIGTMPTKTAWSPWSGETLPANLIPLCMGISSQNEFLFIGVHDKATNTGKLVVIVNWANSPGVQGFPFDFGQPMPGLVQSGVVTGMKVIGTIDLPVKWPTSVSVATSRNTGSDRIEGADGNAAYLSQWNLSTKANRDLFLAKNGGWIATWGKIVVASRKEGKVVQLDATALFQGYRDQYFSTDANYAITRPQRPGNAWWDIYDVATASAWPYMSPAWVPTVTRTLTIPSPTVAWMLETNNGSFVVGSQDGTLRWFKDDGTADGTLTLAGGITSIRDDKYQGGVRSGALTVTLRSARSIVGVRGKVVSWTIQDSKLIDPVDAGTGDTHGVESRDVWVLDFGGKAIRQYRNAPLNFTTQGGASFGTGPTLDGTDVEGLGAFSLPGHPVSGSDSNVN